MESVDNSASTAAAAYFSSKHSGVNNGTSSDSSIANVLGVLVLYSIAMFTLPIGAFFGVRHVLLVEFGISDFSNTFWSVLAAVLAVNIIIAFYVLRAFKEEKAAERLKKQ